MQIFPISEVDFPSLELCMGECNYNIIADLINRLSLKCVPYTLVYKFCIPPCHEGYFYTLIACHPALVITFIGTLIRTCTLYNTDFPHLKNQQLIVQISPSLPLALLVSAWRGGEGLLPRIFDHLAVTCAYRRYHHM